MENENQESPASTMDELTMRIVAAVALLEQMLPKIGLAASEAVGPIVATIEGEREAELLQKLADAEKTIAGLRASAAVHEGRKTLPVSLLAKQESGVAESGALDAALTSLSLEQRIAVKAQLLRAGLV